MKHVEPSGKNGLRDMLANAAWLGTATVAVKPLWFAFITIVCVRWLGAEGYGTFTTVLSLAAIAYSFTSWGVSQYAVREMATNPTRAPSLIASFTALRLMLSILATAGALIAGSLLGYNALMMGALLAACAYSLGLGLLAYSHNVYQAFEVLQYHAAFVIAEKSLVILGGAIGLLVTRSPQWTIAGMAAGAILTAGLSMGWATHRVAPTRADDIDLRLIARSMRPLLPFAAASVLGVVFFRVDTVMVESMLSTVDAGQYGFAFRVVEGLGAFSIVFLDAALYPRLSRLVSEGNVTDMAQLIRSSLWIVLIAGIGISLLVMLSARTGIAWVSQDANLFPAAEVLRLMGWSLPLVGIRGLLTVTLLAWGESSYLARALFGATLLNIIANAVLIPKIGVFGAVGATLIAEACLIGTYTVRYVRLRAACVS